jgi:transposase-like protein
MTCKYCLSETVKPAGSMKGRKLVKCLTCRHRFFENQNLPRMKVNKHAIVTAISLYFEGLSVRKVSRQLENIFGEKVSPMSIWN